MLRNMNRKCGANRMRLKRAPEGGSGAVEPLPRSAEKLNCWSFLCVIAPLGLRAVTGSPVNPIAIF